jgi:hypothetical protein
VSRRPQQLALRESENALGCFSNPNLQPIDTTPPTTSGIHCASSCRSEFVFQISIHATSSFSSLCPPSISYRNNHRYHGDGNDSHHKPGSQRDLRRNDEPTRIARQNVVRDNQQIRHGASNSTVRFTATFQDRSTIPDVRCKMLIDQCSMTFAPPSWPSLPSVKNTRGDQRAIRAPKMIKREPLRQNGVGIQSSRCGLLSLLKRARY